MTSDMSFFIVVQFYARKIGRQFIQLVVEEICAVDLQFGHDILLSFESAVFCDTQSVSDRC